MTNVEKLNNRRKGDIRSAFVAVQLAIDNQLIEDKCPTLHRTKILALQFGARIAVRVDIVAMLKVIDFEEMMLLWEKSK